jgi:hypothetical protein
LGISNKFYEKQHVFEYLKSQHKKLDSLGLEYILLF